MAKGDGSTVHIDFDWVHIEFLDDSESLSREGFI